MRAGREAEFAEFAAAMTPPLLRLAPGLAVPGMTPEDLVQVALLNLWSSWPRARDATSPLAYARQALVNASLSARRRRWRTERPVAYPTDAGVPDMTGTVDSRDQVLRAVRSLPPRQRAAVVLRYLEDLSDSEIANVLSCSVQTVRSQISRALATLRVQGAHDAEEIHSC